MKNIKAVLFDLDGTILNTLDDLYYSTNYALEQFNFPPRTYEEVRTFVGNGVKVLIEKAVPKARRRVVSLRWLNSRTSLSEPIPTVH